MAGHRPIISSVAPSALAVGGSITITGSRLANASSVTIGGTAATRFSISGDEQIIAVIAGGTTTGRVAVTTAGGTTTSRDTVTIVSAVPVVSSISPITGQAGTLVAVTGSGFAGATAVRVGGQGAAFTVHSDTLITAVVPATAVTGKVQVVGPAGNGSSPATFTYLPTPDVAAFSPTTGAATAAISITGSGFTGATVVSVGGTPVTSYVVHSDTLITAVLAGGTATGVVLVTNPNGTSSSVASYTVIPAPTITSFTPGSGPSGTVVIITGTHFLGASAVTFNGVAAADTGFVSDTSIRAVVPDGATTGHIAVTTPGGTVTSVGNFTPAAAPVIDYVSPGAGQVGDAITVYGAGLTGVTVLSVGGTPCTGVSVSGDTSVSGTIAGGTTSGIVSVTSPLGTATSTLSFDIETTPTVSSYSVGSAAVGAAVTITGTGFTGSTIVAFNSTPATFAILSDTKIKATVPQGASTGTVVVTNPAGAGTGPSFTVPSGSPPVVTSMTPNHGITGTSTVIAGTGFTGATHVSFNGTLAASFSVDSDIQITAVTASGVTTGPVSVTTAGGTAASGGNFSNP